jgi:HSP20 family protein
MMTKKTKDTGHKDHAEPLSGIGAVFQGLGSFVELLGNMVEQGEQHIERQGEFKVEGLGDGTQGVYGFSIRSGLGGAPQIRRFGNVRPSPKGPVVSDVREPLVDVFNEGEEIVVTAELPGVTDEELTLTATASNLSLKTAGARRYSKEIALPVPVDPASLRRSFRNGILQVQLRKA